MQWSRVPCRTSTPRALPDGTQERLVTMDPTEAHAAVAPVVLLVRDDDLAITHLDRPVIVTAEPSETVSLLARGPTPTP
jgi:hypothetical protein